MDETRRGYGMGYLFGIDHYEQYVQYGAKCIIEGIDVGLICQQIAPDLAVTEPMANPYICTFERNGAFPC